jgi:hypothetical protein
METHCDFSKPEEVLCAFWREMYEWELEAARSYSRNRSNGTMEQWPEQMQASWKPIFEKYCTKKKRVRSEYRSIGTPFYYDPRYENILEVTYTSTRRVLIKTQQVEKVKGEFIPMGEYFYVLLKQRGKWLVDNRYFYTMDKIVRGTL